jgi:hypothetical protein
MRTVTAVFVLSLLCACATPEPAPRGAYKGPPVQLDSVLRKTGLAPNDVVADLAWEDGSVAVAAGKLGYKGWAYPEDAAGVSKARSQAVAAGVSDKVSVERLRPGISLRDANVIFYSPSPNFGWEDLSNAIKESGRHTGKLIVPRLTVTIYDLRPAGVELEYLGTVADSLALYRYDVRDTVPPGTRKPPPPAPPPGRVTP